MSNKEAVKKYSQTEKGKAAVNYFLNGFEVTDWSKIKPVFQQLFTVIADDVCKNLGLIKWSY